jgi:hypothetical protein
MGIERTEPFSYSSEKDFSIPQEAKPAQPIDKGLSIGPKDKKGGEEKKKNKKRQPPAVSAPDPKGEIGNNIDISA